MADGKLLEHRRLLLADDESFSRFFVVRMVRELGCDEILEAADGEETFAQLRAGGDSLSAIVLDFNMPKANGLQILKAIRTGKAGVPRESNILMLTGSSDFGLVGAAMALDVDAFLIKPVSEAVLAARFGKIFGETRDIKSAEAYEAVDIADVSDRLLNGRPQGTARVRPPVNATPKAPAQARTLPPGTRRVRLDEVTPGAILADHLRGPAGELLLGAASVLSERHLNRLKELQPAIQLESVTIFIKEDA